jgi:hypothetical protein
MNYIKLEISKNKDIIVQKNEIKCCVESCMNKAVYYKVKDNLPIATNYSSNLEDFCRSKNEVYCHFCCPKQITIQIIYKYKVGDFKSEPEWISRRRNTYELIDQPLDILFHRRMHLMLS